jgi:hypothetical protein
MHIDTDMKSHYIFLFHCSSILRNEKIIKYREFHKINLSGFEEDLKNTSFISSSACDLPKLCDQYFNDLSLLLDKYAPLKFKAIHKNN